MKDNFSIGSDKYSKFRPQYPEELYQFILDNVSKFEYAWDCATGNGQVAAKLAKSFDRVEATDLSNNQIQQAIVKENIRYSVQLAEQTTFASNQFDLITVGQALHWFDLDEFFKEAKRVLKPEGKLMTFGYGLNFVNDKIDAIIKNFHFDIIGSYWDKERKHIDDKYASISFPFNNVESLSFQYNVLWNVEHYLGYLNTWSAVKHYQNDKRENPVEIISEQIKREWGTQDLKVEFPIFLTCSSH